MFYLNAFSYYRFGYGTADASSSSTTPEPQVFLVMSRRHHRGPMLINGNFGWGMWEWIWQRG